MGDDSLLWGVPEDAPPPRRRSSWSKKDPQAAPVGRDQQPVPTAPPHIDAPNWSPIVTPDEPGTENIFSAHHVGGGDPAAFADAPNPFASPAAEHTEGHPVEQQDVDAAGETPAAGGPELGSLFSDPTPAVAVAADDVPTISVFGTPVAIRIDAETSSTPAASPGSADHDADHDADRQVDPHADLEETPEALADVVAAVAEDPAQEPRTSGSDAEVTQDLKETANAVDLADAEDAEDRDELPALFLDDQAPADLDQFQAPAAPVAVTDGELSLAAMFDSPSDQAPAPVIDPGSTEVPAVATSPKFATRAEAMAAWQALNEQRLAEHTQEAAQAAEQAAAHDALRYQYANAERLAADVDRVMRLAQTGDPKVQNLIHSFELTRDKDKDIAQRNAYEAALTPLMQSQRVAIGNPAEANTIFNLAYDELIGIGPLGPLWRDDDVTEIMVSGPDKVIVERNGRLIATPVKFRDMDHLVRTARDMARRVDDRGVSRSNPLVTAQLPGARVQFALAPVAPVAGASITIRKFRPLFGLPDLLRFGALSEEMARFLHDAVVARATVLVSGGTGSGKTTMINALSSFIPDDERVITIEDALELKLSNTHVESLLTKESASGDDTVIVGQDDLLRASLRMRPDRIIVGEIRDSSGCFTMLQAANTGHDGTMTTVHANNPGLAIRRLTQFLRGGSNMSDEVAREEVMTAFDLIVQVVRVRGRRFVTDIAVVNPPGTRAADGSSTGAATTSIFTGEFPAGADAPVFRMANPLGSDTELAQRMSDAGLDPTVWSAR